ncbi:hypothetical protein B0H12DRAFT_1155506 [Mycena haematopus]|nr:hypothetical protein B0H12DRAFT_1155506 [Mycena haematopus]
MIRISALLFLACLLVASVTAAPADALPVLRSIDGGDTDIGRIGNRAIVAGGSVGGSDVARLQKRAISGGGAAAVGGSGTT